MTKYVSPSNTYLYRLLQVGFALTTMGMRWMIGVVLRKLLDAGSFFSPSSEGQQQETSTTSKTILDFVFLLDATLNTVVAIAFGIIFVNILCTAGLTAMAVHRSTLRGRLLRNQILTKSVECASCATAGGGEENLNRTATDLIVHVKLLEDFTEFDEHWLVVNYIIIGMALLLSLVFAWQAGLVAMGCFVCSVLVLEVFEQKRKSTVITTIEQANHKVNARLLDVVKNGVKIKLTNQLQQERHALQTLEASSDVARTRNARLKFFREILRQYVLAVIPILMSLLGWHLIQDNPQLALDIGSAVLVAILLLDEAHKAFMHNAFILDKQVGANEAQTAINAFLGDNRNASGSMKQGKQDQSSQPSSKKTKPPHSRLLCCHSSSGTNQEDEEDEDNDTILALDDRDIESNNVGDNHNNKAATSNQSIVLDQICFRYPCRDMPVLKDYSHSFERGQIHGLVGESGSGKSSLLKVIAKLMQPNSGTLQYWEGIKIAYVSQDQKLFARSIRENVSYGATGTPPTDNQIWAALEAANIHEWVASLPHQLDQVLVRGEADVSGGQLQRLNLAHLFCVCQTSDLILLDEVLSALDQTSRTILLEQLNHFIKQEEGTAKTAIIITHHSEMLSICDQVHEMPTLRLSSQDTLVADDTAGDNDKLEWLADTTDCLDSEIY